MGARSKFVEDKRSKIMFERFGLFYHLKELFIFNKKEYDYISMVIHI
jgi:hypothetical protein